MIGDKNSQPHKNFAEENKEQKIYKVIGRIEPRRHVNDAVDEFTGKSFQENDNIDEYNNIEARNTAPPFVKNDELTSLDHKEKIRGRFSSAADAQAIGRILTAAREEAGLTKAALAAEMQTGPRSIIRLENGEQNPTVDTISKFAKALGYTVRIELIKSDLGQ